MIELYAKARSLEIPSAITRLAQHHAHLPATESAAASYQKEQIRRRGRLWKLWRDSRKTGRIQNSTLLQKLIQELRFHSDLTDERYRRGPGRLFGGAYYTDVERAYYLINRPPARTGTRIFRGRGWGDVLVIPFYDMPWRICGLYCIGREGRSQDRVFSRVPYQSEHTEAGLAFHPDVMSGFSKSQKPLVAVNDPLIVIRLQIRQFQQSHIPLPLISWWENESVRTRNSWNMFHDRDLVIWSPRREEADLRQAAEINAKISTAGPHNDDQASWDAYLTDIPPDRLVDRITRMAEPWETVLDDHLRGLTDVEAEELIIRWREQGSDTNRLLSACRADQRKRLTTLCHNSNRERSVDINRMTIREQENGWYGFSWYGSRVELVVDAILRIDAVIHHAHADETYYQGRIIYQGKTYPFHELRRTVEKKPLEWMRDFLLQRGSGFLRFSPRWNNHLLAVATQIQPPEFLQGADVVGWDAKQAAYVLPRYNIDGATGQVDSHTRRAFPPNSPAESLEAPQILTPAEAEQLTQPDDDQLQTCWAVAAAVISNILSPALRRRTCGIGLHGQSNAYDVRSLAEALGCPALRAVDYNDVQKLLDAERRHNWPAFLMCREDFRSVALNAWINLEFERPGESHNCLVCLDPYTAHVKQLSGDWHVVESPHPLQIPSSLSEAFRRLVPAYLQDFCRRNAGLAEAPDNGWATDVLEDLAEFLDRNRGRGDTVRQSRSRLSPDQTPADAAVFASLLEHLVRAGNLQPVPRGFEESEDDLVRDLDNWSEPALLIGKYNFRRCLAEKTPAALDLERVTAALSHDGALLEDRPDIWVLREGWWGNYVSAERARRSGRLQIYG